jgi:hypothetical protein
MPRVYSMLFLFLAGLLACDAALGQRANRETVSIYEHDGEDVKILISEIPISGDLEGRLKTPLAFYTLKLKYRDNVFIFNLPQRSFDELSGVQKEKLIQDLLGLYDRSFELFFGIFGFIPTGFRFIVTFGETKKQTPFNYIYQHNKISNIFPGFLPFSSGEEALNPEQRFIFLHEIGHSLFSIAIGNITNPKARSIEEGFVDYFAEQASGMDIKEVHGQDLFYISRRQSENIKGLTQLDTEISIWGEKYVMTAPRSKGYVGLTHHAFGLQFIKAFVSVFGAHDLPVFLKRFKPAQYTLNNEDYGTAMVRKIFAKMGYPPEKVSEFEDQLHRNLTENVFKVKSE